MDVTDDPFLNDDLYGLSALSSPSNGTSTTFGYNLVNVSNSTNINLPCYKTEWESFPEFRVWLRPVLSDSTKAWCRACEKMFKADLKSLRVHGAGKSHSSMVQKKLINEIPNTTPAVSYNVITDKKGTYGIGIITRPDTSFQVGGHSLYIDPTNSSPNLIACGVTPEKDNSYVIVSLPTENTQNLNKPITENINEDPDPPQFHELQQLQEFDPSGIGFESCPNTFSSKLISEGISTNRNDFNFPTDSEQIMETDISGINTANLIDLEGIENIYDFSIPEGSVPQRQETCLQNVKKKTQLDTILPTSLKNQPVFSKAMVSYPAPFWNSMAVINDYVTELKLTDYKGRYLVLLFYVKDYSKLCTEEISAVNDRLEEFRSLNTEVVACSVDSYETHLAWSRTTRMDGGIEFPRIALLSDQNHDISQAYGCYKESLGHSLRATYIIDQDGIIRSIMTNDIKIGRSVSEIVRLVQAFQHADANQTYCLTDWTPHQNATVFTSV